MRYLTSMLLLASTLPVWAANPAFTPSGAQQKDSAAIEETPNQRRQRLGLPIQESFPPLSYGEAVETPNHRRKRLGLPMPASFTEAQYGITEETPNHRRQRLAGQANTDAGR